MSDGTLAMAARSVLSGSRRWSLGAAVVWTLVALALAHHVAWAIRHFAHPVAGDHDFGVYFGAAHALAAGHPLYGSPPPCCFDPAAMTGRYTYPPLLAMALRPFASLEVDTAGRLFLVAMYGCLAAAAVVAYRIPRGRLGWGAAGCLLATALVYHPVIAGLYVIQADAVVVLLEAVTAWGIVRERGAIAGAALGLAAALKVSPVLLAPALLLLPRAAARRGLAAFGIVLAGALLAMRLATSETTDYFLRVLPSFSSGVADPGNLSAPGVVLRVLDWEGHRPGIWFKPVVLGVGLVMIVGTWVACRGARTPTDRACAVGALLAAPLITQGVTWDHHLVTELLVVALIAPSLRATSRRWWLALAGLALSEFSINVREATAGLQPGHGWGMTPAIAIASIDLAAMTCLWLAALACVRPRPATSATYRRSSRALIPRVRSVLS